ncbi:glycerophosphodiester phosphodiesterase GDPD1, chloroplastic-like protein [Tanacetum coccineum]
MQVKDKEIEELRSQLLQAKDESMEVARLRTWVSSLEAIEGSLRGEVASAKEHNGLLEQEHSALKLKVTSLESIITEKDWYQIFTKRQKSKLNRTKPSTDLERARKTEAKGTKGLKTELKRKLSNRLDKVCAFKTKRSQSQPRDTSLEKAWKTKPEKPKC